MLIAAFLKGLHDPGFAYSLGIYLDTYHLYMDNS